MFSTVQPHIPSCSVMTLNFNLIKLSCLIHPSCFLWSMLTSIEQKWDPPDHLGQKHASRSDSVCYLKFDSVVFSKNLCCSNID